MLTRLRGHRGVRRRNTDRASAHPEPLIGFERSIEFPSLVRRIEIVRGDEDRAAAGARAAERYLWRRAIFFKCVCFPHGAIRRCICVEGVRIRGSTWMGQFRGLVPMDSHEHVSPCALRVEPWRPARPMLREAPPPDGLKHQCGTGLGSECDGAVRPLSGEK